MSNARYIELTSRFRNRNRFSNPAEFEVNLSQAGSAPKNGVEAIDPVLKSFPSLIYSAAFDKDTPSLTVSGTFDFSGGVAETSGPQTYVIVSGSSQFQQEENFYKGAIITNTTLSPVQSRRITSYKYLGTNRALITTDVAFSDATVDTNAWSIINPSDNTADAVVFIPTGIDADNYYNGYTIQKIDTGNNSPGETRTITSYNGTTKLATLSAVWSSAIVATSTIEIRKENFGVSGTSIAGGAVDRIILDASASDTDGVYVGQYIRTNISNYPVTGNNGVVDVSGVMGLTTGGTSQGGDVRRIIAYFGTAQTSAVYGAVSAHTAIVGPNFSQTPSAEYYELLNFTRDNVVPLNYTGSTVSQQQDVCYEIELINLTLPNLPLTTGSRITFYQSVYVEFSSVSKPNRDIIYSNNPYSGKALFRASIDDVPNLITSSFVKIDGDGMIQTVKFKPNDNFRFRVFFPFSGDTFQTVESDNLSPLEPNPILQITALFQIKRVI